MRETFPIDRIGEALHQFGRRGPDIDDKAAPSRHDVRRRGIYIEDADGGDEIIRSFGRELIGDREVLIPSELVFVPAPAQLFGYNTNGLAS